MQEFATVLQKYEDRLSKANHVDGKQLALNYLFPLIRKLAGAVGEALAEHEEAINDIEDALQNDGDVLAQARDTIVMLATLLDETMVTAGFYTATNKGLQDTGKAPAELRAKFVDAAQQVVATMQAIEEELNGEDEEDAEVESDGAGGAEENAASGAASGAGSAVASLVAAGNAAVAVAREPDAIIEGNNAPGSAAAPVNGSEGAATDAAQ
jgi:hypothetical protein